MTEIEYKFNPDLQLTDLNLDRINFVTSLGARSELLFLAFRKTLMTELNQFLAKIQEQNKIYVGDTPPEDTTKIWIDTSSI